jgi:hypothetical protein
MMTNKVVNPEDCQEAIEATYGIFANPTQGPDFEAALRSFGETYRPAFDNVKHPKYDRLLKQSSNLLASIQDTIGHYVSPELYFPVLDIYLRSVPLTVSQLHVVLRGVRGGHFQAIAPAQQATVLHSLLRNVIDFGVFERQALIEAQRLPRYADGDSYFLSEVEKVTAEMFHAGAKHRDDQFFQHFHAPFLSHVFSLRGMAQIYNPIALCLFGSEQAIKLERFSEGESSPTKCWIASHHAEVVQAILAHSWHGKFNEKFVEKMDMLGPQFTEITNAITLRAHNLSSRSLVDLRRDHGVTPDEECIHILKGAYNTEPGVPEEWHLRALMTYSLMYENLLGDDWKTPEGSHPVTFVETCVRQVETFDSVNPESLDSIALHALSLLTAQHSIDWVSTSEVFKPYLRNHRHYQGLRLCEGLGL